MNSKQKFLTLPPGVEVSPTGLKITARLSYEQWEELGARLQGIHKSILWWVGDWLAWGEQVFNQDFSQAIEAIGYRNQTLLNAQWVASRVDNSRRRESLSWSHHLEIAALEPSAQDRFLDLAIENHWSTRELREEVRKAKSVSTVEQISESRNDGTLEASGHKASENNLELEVEHNARAIDVQSISERAIEFLQRELEGATEEEIARVIHAIVQAFMLPTAENLSEDWDEAAILRTEETRTLEKVQLVKTIFPGARVR